jgi:hypothetical protein
MDKLLATGFWLLATGDWLLVTGYWLITIDSLLQARSQKLKKVTPETYINDL